MVATYRINSPLNREERTNLNDSLQDALSRLISLQRQVNVISGDQEIQLLIETIEKIINDGNASIAEMQTAIEEGNEYLDSFKQAEDDIKEVIDSANESIEANTRTVDELVVRTEEELGNMVSDTNDTIQGIIDDVDKLTTDLSGYNIPIESFVITKKYIANQAVRFNGSTYRAKVITQNNPLPTNSEVENEWWTLEAQRGVDGDGAVSSVAGILPGINGDVIITPQDIGALGSEHLAETTLRHIEIVNELPTDFTGRGILFHQVGATENAPDRPTYDALLEDVQEVSTKVEKNTKRLDNLSIDISNMIVADGVTDDLEALVEIMAIPGIERVIFPKSKTIFISDHLVLTDSSVKVIDMNGSSVRCEKGAIKSNRNYSNPVEVLNGTLIGNNKTYVGVAVGLEVPWGNCMLLTNMTIRGFAIGLQINGSFLSDFANLKIIGCKIGIALYRTAGAFFSNSLKFEQLYLDYNTYGIYMQNCYDFRVERATIEHSTHGIVFGRTLSLIELQDSWFEANIESDVTCGEINLDTFVLTKSVNDVNLSGIKFTNTRRAHDYPFVDEKYKFSSKYYNSGNHYSTDFTFDTGLAYDNLVTTLPTNFAGVRPQDTVTTGFRSTFFGNLNITSVSGTNFPSNLRALSNLNNSEFKLNDYIYLKALVKISDIDKSQGETYVTFSLLSGTGATLGTAFAKKIPMSRWYDVYGIIRMTTISDNNQLYFGFYPNRNSAGSQSTNASLEIDVTNIMAVNLTTVFGEGNEPTEGMGDEFFKHLKYKPGKMPLQGRYVGDTFFNIDTSKQVWWNGTTWVDSTGTAI